MASKSLKLSVAGAEVAADLQSKISKDDLYGRVVQIVEQEGRALERGWLLPDGSLFRKSQIAMTAVDPEGSPAESPAIQSAGQTLELRPSSFDNGESLEPVPMETLARFVTTDVYPLEATGLAQGLYKGSFNYRKSARPRDALLLVREDGAFLLAGQLKACPLLARTVAYDFFDAQESPDEAGDPLDFSMM
ncbi:MAG TPA: hypothetical protein VHM91_24685 [Verrucomicrobiales bacterium]|jgi:hypothetical protein|nr:hypothetical protein [Verrucomicrobiales bacterium]